MKCVIIGGAPISNYEAAGKYIDGGDFIICCDSGLYHAQGLGAVPSLIVGDFDSHPAPDTDIETITLPCEKDDTDTVFAAKTAVERGYDEFVLLGAAGGRLDHTLCNVSILLFLFERGKRAVLADDFSEMEIVGAQEKQVDSSFSYFSLISLGGTAQGVTVTGAKYPLCDAQIKCDYQYGVSNEVSGSLPARVSCRHGRLLLIKVR